MTEENKPGQGLPGDKFVRPGIDDRPDLNKALTPEQKAAVERLAMQPSDTKNIEGSSTEANVATAQASAANLATAVASVDAAAPDLNSAFNDMRDPMVSADGHRPTKAEIVRLGVGFTLSAVACAIPWVALSSLILPELLDQIDPSSRDAMIGSLNAVGSVVALLANVIFGTFSDLTRSRFGRRTPWIIAGGVVTGLCALLLGATHSHAVIMVAWCGMQLGYNVMLAPFVATMSDRVPDKVRGTVSGFYGAGIACGQTLGSLVGAQVIKAAGLSTGFMMAAIIFGCIGLVTVVVWPREKSSRDLPREPFSAKMLLMSFRPPRNAPDFYYALFGRTMMMAGYNMIVMYQLYIVKYYTLADSGLKEQALADEAANIIAIMATITLVISLIAALIAGPLTDKIGMRKVPVAIASCLYAVGVLMPWLIPSAMGMYLFAAIAGFGYGVYNAIDQALNVSVLPNPDEAGKDLGILNLANTLCTVLGSLLGSIVVVISGQNYMWIFPVAIVLVLVAAFLIMRIKNVK